MIRVAMLMFVLLSSLACADDKPPGYAIASAHPLATAAGTLVLENGGNAFDAAAAITAALAVVEPTGSGLGGGGFYVLYRAKDGYKTFLDARERAPLAATADMYLDSDGEVVNDDLRRGAKAAGIPGIPAALEYLAGSWGKLPLTDTLRPAISYAVEGFEVYDRLARIISWRADDLRQSPAAAAVFLPAGKPLAAGDILRQPELAKTLIRIAKDGGYGFYDGRFARKLVDGVREAGGIWARKDLLDYRVKERAPVVLEYRGWEIVTAPPPSSGGLVMGEVFNMLRARDFSAMSRDDKVHFLAESWRRAYRDRALYMGDSDFVDVPSRKLLLRSYGEQLASGISMQKATASADLGELQDAGSGGTNTTHFSVIDAQGNRVAATLSINYALGSAFMVPGTGVLLNNEMDDFVAKPGAPNGYGLVGGKANAIEPGKRMLSSMSPAIISGEDRVGIIGTPGGSRIITMVMLGILDFIEGASAEQIVTAPRFHHQYLPDQIYFEDGALSSSEQRSLKQRGHELKQSARRYGNMQVVIWDRTGGTLDAASDPRGEGGAVTSTAPQ